MKKKIFTAMTILTVLFAGCGSSSNVASNNVKNEQIEIIDDVTKYSKISVDDLKNIMGEPLLEENWSNQTSSGTYELTILSYDKDSNHYEFIIGDGVVVKLTIYSSMDWNGTGELFSYSGDKSDIPAMFGIKLGSNVENKGDTGYAYRISNVNDSIADVHVLEMADDCTFGMIKFTYDEHYFE